MKTVCRRTLPSGAFRNSKSLAIRTGTNECLPILRNSSIPQLQPVTPSRRRKPPCEGRCLLHINYALFHFLIDEACTNWVRTEQRGRLARTFEHKQMSNASNRCAAKYTSSSAGSPEWHLNFVASAFHQLQEKRHAADYDRSGAPTSADVVLLTQLVEDAFASWRIIQHEQIAHDYLFSLLFRER